MVTEIIQELTAVTKTNEMECNQVFSWTKRVEVQRAQKWYLTQLKKTGTFM